MRVVVAAVDVVAVALLLKSLLPGVVYMSRLAILAEHHSGGLRSNRRHRKQSHATNFRSFFPRRLIRNIRTSDSGFFLNHVTPLTSEQCRQSRPTSTKLLLSLSVPECVKSQRRPVTEVTQAQTQTKLKTVKSRSEPTVNNFNSKRIPKQQNIFLLTFSTRTASSRLWWMLSLVDLPN